MLEIGQLRELRQGTKALSESVLEDLLPFVHTIDKQTFVRLPDSKQKRNDVGVTVTCSCLMGLALTGRLSDFVEKRKSDKWDPRIAFKKIMEDPVWISSGLESMNAFTATLVLRTFGFLVNKGILHRADARRFVHTAKTMTGNTPRKAILFSGRRTKWTIRDLFKALATNPLDQLAVEKYPTSSAIVYWFLDAIQRSKQLRSFGGNFWEKIAAWASKEFRKQVSLVTSGNDALMDPVAMAMAACLCKKLKTVAEDFKNAPDVDYLSFLPSESELEFSIKLLFGYQAPSGIWPKYFPLFHYPDAGGNFCFTFEMLEAVLNEFGKGDEIRILEIEGAFEGLSKALQWCERNRFEYQFQGRSFTGWNSGGQLKSLTAGKPESWATAVIHMFLWELEDVISRKIEQKLLTLYKAKRYKRRESALDEFLDIEILIRNRSKSLKSILKKHVISPALKDETELRRKGLSGRISALLFGPPGTSKTELCKAVAKRLGWPLVEIDPSDFLKGGLEAISVQADRIFTDLMDLSGAVVLFDEMDALVQTRDTEDWHLDTTSQLLTTSMLPKLTKLHDKRRSIFFMATNFQNRFDPAIKRAGRFDLLLCMGPPTLQSKLLSVGRFFKGPETEGIARLLAFYTREPELAQMFELLTFGETNAFFQQLSSAGHPLAFLKTLRKTGFKNRLKVEGEFNTLRAKDLEFLPEELRGKTMKELERDERVNFEFLKEQLKYPIVRYLADKRQSKIQS